MNKETTEFIRAKKIDTVFKLNLLLLLYRNPDMQGTPRCFAEKLHLGDVGLVEEVVTELADKGVINHSGQQYSLANTPEIEALLQHLAHFYEYPLSRQALLEQIQIGGQYGRY